MRSFDDERGCHWQAALMEASFGSVVLVFTRIGGTGVLHTALDAANFPDAEAWLADASEDRLLAMLAGAETWQ